MVALKAGARDYHFIVRVDNVWYNKSGVKNEIIKNFPVEEVTEDIWCYFSYDGKSKPEKHDESKLKYTDETIYFAIKKEWYNE